MVLKINGRLPIKEAYFFCKIESNSGRYADFGEFSELYCV